MLQYSVSEYKGGGYGYNVVLCNKGFSEELPDRGAFLQLAITVQARHRREVFGSSLNMSCRQIGGSVTFAEVSRR